MKNLILLLLLFPFIYSSGQDIARVKHDQKTGMDAEVYSSFTFDGAWCWFSDPRAVYFEGQHKRTYAGWIDRYGDVCIGSYDHASGRIDTKVIYDGLQVDDHDDPSILFDDQGRLLVFFNKHGGPNPLYFCKSENPEDIGNWGPVKRLALNDTALYKDMWDTYTYTNTVKLSEEDGRIFLFWRGIDNKPNYATSDDDGETWTKGRIFILPDRLYPNRRPYLKVFSNGRDVIHFAFTDGHPRKESQNSIYYMYYRDGGLYHADGEKIGNLGDEVAPRMADCVYDAIPSEEKAWIWDVAENESGYPVIAYAKFPDDSNHVYCYASWDGKTWNNKDLVNAGPWFPETMEGQEEREPNYSGGMNIDHENTNTLYLSIKRDSVFEIEKWETGNRGKSWKASRITNGSSKNNVRPVAVRGAPVGNPLQVLWMCNTRYRHYTDYQAAIQMGLVPGPVSGGLDSNSILDVMHRVADWQIMNPREPHQLNWHYGAFYTGVWTLYKTTGEERYKNEIWNLGQKYNWKLLNDIYHADRLTIAQSFVDLYMEEKDPEMLEKIQWVLDMHLDRRPPADVRYKDNPYSGEWWTWCDALYMAPPTFVRVYKATGEKKYLEYMNQHWWKTSDYLYSKEDSLFYRDDRFFDHRTENGKKLFWGRGNGWVIAGLARIIPYIPEDYPDRGKFVQQFKEMAAKLLRIQDEDGLWRVSLDDPAYLDIGESSGSAFFTFALAWGVNNDMLDPEHYSPAILKAWKALVGNVNQQGRLGFVQQVAGSPYPFFDYQSHVYASGAFLLAGCEILKLIE